jgi:hypothetical protein
MTVGGVSPERSQAVPFVAEEIHRQPFKLQRLSFYERNFLCARRFPKPLPAVRSKRCSDGWIVTGATRVSTGVPGY